jgi:deoxyadenosine/deoxycytidine kinase
LIFLNVPADELMKRIKKRGREMEEGITHHYLHKIAEAYERFIEAMRPHTAVLVWDGREATWEYLVEAYNKEFHRTEKVILKH